MIAHDMLFRRFTPAIFVALFFVASILYASAQQTPAFHKEQFEALRTRVMAQWAIPVGEPGSVIPAVVIRIRLSPNGTLTEPPMVISTGRGKLFKAVTESAVNAIFKSQPFDMLKLADYQLWKEIDFTFDASTAAIKKKN